jgi:hypothetical protein
MLGPGETVKARAAAGLFVAGEVPRLDLEAMWPGRQRSDAGGRRGRESAEVCAVDPPGEHETGHRREVVEPAVPKRRCGFANLAAGSLVDLDRRCSVVDDDDAGHGTRVSRTVHRASGQARDAVTPRGRVPHGERPARRDGKRW